MAMRAKTKQSPKATTEPETATETESMEKTLDVTDGAESVAESVDDSVAEAAEADAAPAPSRKRARTEDEKEKRRMERIMRNRQAAHASREKKRKHVEELESQVVSLHRELALRDAQVAAMREQQLQLLEQNNRLIDKLQMASVQIQAAHAAGDVSLIDALDFHELVTKSVAEQELLATSISPVAIKVEAPSGDQSGAKAPATDDSGATPLRPRADSAAQSPLPTPKNDDCNDSNDNDDVSQTTRFSYSTPDSAMLTSVESSPVIGGDLRLRLDQQYTLTSAAPESVASEALSTARLNASGFGALSNFASTKDFEHPLSPASSADFGIGCGDFSLFDVHDTRYVFDAVETPLFNVYGDSG